MKHTPYEKLEAITKKAAEKHPELGLTFGYIGNCSIGAGNYDDRNWYIFTKVRNYHLSTGHYKFGGYQTEQLEEFANEASKNLYKWIEGVVIPRK